MPAISRASSASYLMIVAQVKNHSGYLPQLQVHLRKRVDTEIMKSKIKCKKYRHMKRAIGGT
jgi:hypothetical protein